MSGNDVSASPAILGPTGIERGSRTVWSALALGALLFSAVVGLQMLQSPSSPSAAMTGEGDSTRQVIYAALFAVSICLYATRPVSPLPLSMIVLLAWCWISLTWAIEPAIAFRRLTLTTMIILSIFWLVAETGPERALRVFGHVLLLALLSNFLWVGLGWGVHVPGELDPALVGNWRGATIHKNVAGAVCALTILVLILYPPFNNELMRFIALVLSLVFLFFTQSKTSIALMAVAVILGLVYLWMGSSRRLFIIPCLFIFVACGVAFGLDYFDLLLDQFSDPNGFTGRVQIWPVLVQFAGDHPWLGAGFGSFWNIGDASPVRQLTNGWVSRLATGHNGYLDVLVQVGFPGLTLAIFVTMLLPLWVLMTRREIPARLGAALVSMLVFCAGHNLTESSLLDRDMVVWVTLAFVLAVQRQAVRKGNEPTPPKEGAILAR